MRARPGSCPARESRSPTQAQMDLGPEGWSGPNPGTDGFGARRNKEDRRTDVFSF